MAENTGEVKMTPTLGLTGLTMNAMALIAPGAFLWLTFAPQATEGATAPSMWIGILFALLLCLAMAAPSRTPRSRPCLRGSGRASATRHMTPWRRCPTACSQLRWRPTSGPSCSTC